MAKSAYDTIPQLKLKGEDYYHEVPDNINIELYVEWKNRKIKRDFVSNVKSFEKKGNRFAIVNTLLPSHAYTYDINEVKRVFVVFDSKDKELLDA